MPTDTHRAWLLDGDPAIRWQTRRDLSDAPPAAYEPDRPPRGDRGLGRAAAGAARPGRHVGQRALLAVVDFDRLHTAAAPPGFAVAEPTGSAGFELLLEAEPELSRPRLLRDGERGTTEPLVHVAQPARLALVEPGFVKGEFLVVWQRALRPPRTLIAGDPLFMARSAFLHHMMEPMWQCWGLVDTSGNLTVRT